VAELAGALALASPVAVLAAAADDPAPVVAVFAHATPSARNAPQTANARMPSILTESRADNPLRAPIEEPL